MTAIEAPIRKILCDWEQDSIKVEDHKLFVTIAGRYRGIAHAGSRADHITLAQDLDRIAKERAAATALPVETQNVDPAPPPPPVLEDLKPDPEDLAAKLAAAEKKLAAFQNAARSGPGGGEGTEGEGGSADEGGGEAMPDALSDLLGRLVEPDADEEAKKAALMKRLISLEGLIRLQAASPADWAEYDQLTRYASWFK